METAKSLSQMSANERKNLISVVVESLEGFSGEAEEIGDLRFAVNSRAVACTLRGAGRSGCKVQAVEQLMELVGVPFPTSD